MRIFAIKKFFSAVVLSTVGVTAMHGAVTYNVPAVAGDATGVLQQVIEMASGGGDASVINLAPGAEYHVYRTSATPQLRHISNTASAEENFDNGIKYIALNISGASNLTLDGNGAKIVTHGELTTFALEQCEGVTLRNFTLSQGHMTMPSMCTGRIFVSPVSPTSAVCG